MADAYIYEQDCEDFTTLGMCGRLTETKCEFEEKANGLSELTLEHPIDAAGRFALLIPGRIIKATVPVRNVPEIGDDNALVKVVEKWTVRTDATKAQRAVYNKRDDQIEALQDAAEAAGQDSSEVSKIKKKKLKTMKPGAKVTVTRDYGDDIPEVKIKTGSVTGFIDKDALTSKQVITYSGADTFEGVSAWYEDNAPSWTAKEQLFRIYSMKREDDKVTVQARHVFYDSMYALTKYNTVLTRTMGQMLSGIKSNCIGTCMLDFYTNITGTRVGGHYTDMNIVETILDEEYGVATRWSADVIRDNFDVYLIENAGFDRGVVLEYGKDLKGVTYELDWENIVTHVRPVGEKKNGEPLYLTSAAGWVKSDNRDLYPYPRVATLSVSEAKVSDDMTTTEARAKMRAAAEELLDGGADMPEVSVDVKFQLLGETAEYEVYKGLKNLYLFDTVRVVNRRLKVDTSAKVHRIVWDCRTERMTEVELGSVSDISPTISSFQISSVNGSKIVGGTVSAYAIEDGTIDAAKIDVGSVWTYIQTQLPSYLTTYLGTYLATYFGGILTNIQNGDYDADAQTQTMYDIVIGCLPAAEEESF